MLQFIDNNENDWFDNNPFTYLAILVAWAMTVVLTAYILL
jgi:hypothetical protein